MDLGVVIGPGCTRGGVRAAFWIMERCGVRPACAAAGLQEAVQAAGETAAAPLWVDCRDALADRTLLLPYGPGGLRPFHLRRAGKRPLRFCGMLLTGRGIREGELLCLLHGLGCGRYLFLGGWPGWEHPRCLTWDCSAPPGERLRERMAGQLCDLMYFSEKRAGTPNGRGRA